MPSTFLSINNPEREGKSKREKARARERDREREREKVPLERHLIRNHGEGDWSLERVAVRRCEIGIHQSNKGRSKPDRPWSLESTKYRKSRGVVTFVTNCDILEVPAGFPEHWHCFILQFLIINGGLGRTRTSEHQYLERAAAARALSGVVYICTIRMSVRDL